MAVKENAGIFTRPEQRAPELERLFPRPSTIPGNKDGLGATETRYWLAAPERIWGNRGACAIAAFQILARRRVGGKKVRL